MEDPTAPIESSPIPVPHKGVYQAARKIVTVQDDQLYVPPFMGPEFMRFLGRFAASPGNNPVFMREWRRNKRRVPLLATHPVFGAALLGLAAVVLMLPLLLLIHQLPVLPSSLFLFRRSYELVLVAVFFGASIGGGLFAFFAGLHCSREFSTPVLLEELAVTPLRPQEIVFGFLTGGILPLSLPAIPLIPAIAIFSLDLTIRDLGVFGDQWLVALGMIIWFVPNVVSSMLASGAIAASLSFGESGYRPAAAKGIMTWIVIALLVMSIPYLLVMVIWPYSFLLGVPVLIIIRLVIAGAFLHHMAVRAAQWQTGFMRDDQG